MCSNRPQFLVSERLQRAGFPHAFFTRQGGVSGGAYASLNFSQSVGDEPAAVLENLERARAVLGVRADELYFVRQVHGRGVVTIDGAESAEAVWEREADAIVSLPGARACGVRVADCVPVLLGDPRTRIVAAVHAGWRGLVAHVVAAAVGQMQQLGARASDILAAVGPHISVQAFEVEDHVADQLARVGGSSAVVQRSTGLRPHVDLRCIARHQLEAAGLPTAHVDDVHGCTFGDPVRFFSFRRDGKRGGRHLAAIVAGV